ncbi:angio-associated migratory cell protein [Tanacetum coccineum]
MMQLCSVWSCYLFYFLGIQSEILLTISLSRRIRDLSAAVVRIVTSRRLLLKYERFCLLASLALDSVEKDPWKDHVDDKNGQKHRRKISPILVASGSLDGVIQVWDISLGNLKCTLDGPGAGIEWVKWHPRGHLVLACSEDASVWMWNADNSALLNTFSGHASAVTCGDFNPDGKQICRFVLALMMRVLGYGTQGLARATMWLKIQSNVLDSHMVLFLSQLHESVRVSGTSYSQSRKIQLITYEWVNSCAPWAATGSMDQKHIIWDLQHSLTRCTCEHEEGVTCLSWLGASRFVATGCVDGKVRIWDCLSGDCVKTFVGHKHAIQSLAVSSDRSHLVSVSLDGTARAFEIDEFN